MGRIDDLIQQYCPEGVEYVKLGDVANLMRGKVISKTDIRDNYGSYPVYSSQTANDGVLGTIDTYMYDGSYLTWTTDGAYAGTIFRRKGRFNITNVCGLIDIINTNVNESFLFYWLSVEAPKYVYRGMGNPKLMSNVMSTIEIPLPPLPVQEAIVEILDKFDRLSAELQAELQARKQQYEYYRNQLLTRFAPEQPVTEYSLGELAPVLRGKRLTKSQLSEIGKYKVFHGGIDPIGYYNEANREADTVMIINVGASAGTVGYSNETFWSSDGCFCLKHNGIIISKYLYYYLQTKEYILKSRVRHAGIPTLDNKDVEALKICVPSLEEQARIVAILDKFEALVNDLSQGLPAEIAAVQEQYEYYRNKLLTFKTKE